MNSLRARSRDNSRTPMQWDSTRHGGFTSGEPWIAVNPNFDDVNAAAAVADPGSVFHHYRRLIALRHEMRIVVHGDFELLESDHPAVFAYRRMFDDESLLVVANLSGDDVRFDVPAEFDGAKVLVGTLSETLAPWQSYVVYAG
jgi:glycosidase